MNLIIFGPPASGKGTQAKLIAEKFNLKHISTGDILRENASDPKIKEYMEKGLLVPDEIVFEFLKREIENLGEKEGFLLDGFPRNLKQAEMLNSFLKEKNLKINKVIYLEVEDKEIIKRISGRRICPNCGATYNIYLAPPKEDEICDKCKTKLIQREDDKEEIIKKRLEVYKEQTLPLLEYYKKDLIKVDGSKSIEEVFREILDKLNNP